MAGRNGVDQETANDVVRESLGLTADDLGMNAGEDAFSQDDDGSSDQDQGDNDSEHDNEFEQPQTQARQEQTLEDDLTVQPAQAKQQPTPDRLPPTAEVKVDGRGNLVDRQTGKIVARAGAEARMYQKLHRTTQAYGHLQAQHADVEQRLQKAVEIGTGLFDKLKELQNQQGETSPQKFGLNNHEAIEALTFAKEAKSDPVGTIKKLLTRAASSGIDLTSIGLAGGNFDPKALLDIIRGEINTVMNPLKERSQRETAQEQQQREATERENAAKSELNSFLTANPAAREYLSVFQRVYSQPQFQHMSLNEVWARLQLNLMRRQQQPPNNQRPANQQQQRRRQPLPNGRNAPPSGGRGKDDLASVSTSYEDIVRGLLTT